MKFLHCSLRFKCTRDQLKPHVQEILTDVCLPLFITSERDYAAFGDDAVEYLRAQLDFHQEHNVKRQAAGLAQKLCSIKYERKKGPPAHLGEYLRLLGGHFEQHAGENLQARDALLYAFASVNEKCWLGQSPESNQLVQQILERFAYCSLGCADAMLISRACQVYASFARFEFTADAHLVAAGNAIVNLLHHEHVVVRVDAAIAVGELLEHEAIVKLVRPGLGNMLRDFLRIMDELDVEQLVKALSKIVDAFGEELAPYAVSLCRRLGEAYLRLLQAKGSHDDEDSEIGLTADGLMSAIRRVLRAISGKFPQMYPELEGILEQPIYASLSEQGLTAADEGLTCVSELIYNQTEVSPRMWGFFSHIVQAYLEDRGIIDDVSQASVPLINFMEKAPAVFKASHNG